MARPTKKGADYFPLDSSFCNDDKIRTIRSEFGGAGVYLLLYLLCEIYSKEGYYMKWNDEACAIAAECSACGFDAKTVKDIVCDALRIGFFDAYMEKKCGILTSAAIQRRYVRIFSCRTHICFVKPFFLLDVRSDYDFPVGTARKCIFSDTERPEPCFDADEGKKRKKSVTENADKGDVITDKKDEKTQNEVNGDEEYAHKEKDVDVSGSVNEENMAESEKRFEAFWDIYPRKLGYSAAKKEFCEISPDMALTETILRAVAVMKESREWCAKGGKFIPGAARWLHEQRWKDVPMSSRYISKEQYKESLDASWAIIKQTLEEDGEEDEDSGG